MGNPEREAYREAFWESLVEHPDVRFMLVGLVECDTLQEWADRWHFKHHEQARRFLRTNLCGRLQDIGGGEAVRFLQMTMGSRGI